MYREQSLHSKQRCMYASPGPAVLHEHAKVDLWHKSEPANCSFLRRGSVLCIIFSCMRLKQVRLGLWHKTR